MTTAGQKDTDVAVLGAGLTGSCTALELARRGHTVALLDQDPVPMNRASRRNEGKIHLGLIYAADSSLTTARLQLRGALSFGALLERWLGEDAHRLHLSTPFAYLVARDSVLSADELEGHYAALEDVYHRSLSDSPGLSYLGTRPRRLAWRLGPHEVDRRLNGDLLSAVFGTSELAVDTDQLADLVCAAIAASPSIQFHPAHEVREIGRTGDGFEIAGDAASGPWAIRSRSVINATWENRIGLDATLHHAPPPGWLYRLKYRVLARLPDDLRGAPSTTMVLGRYGDVVVRPDGTAYLSWYPAGLRGWSDELRPPASWEPACRGEENERSAEIAAEILAGLEPWYPGIKRCTPFQVDAGAIVAYGKTDVDDPDSGLHDRSRVGVFSDNGYHSVDPGKLTTAPLFAMEAAGQVAAESDRPSGAPQA
jgi:glycine/D-amino acid oxidase-like deaminating enzyme